MKYGAIIACFAALCGAVLSNAPALEPEEALEGVYYDITCSPEELQAETDRCKKMLKQKGEAAVAKSAKTKSRVKDAEAVVEQWDAPKMARFSLLGRAVQNYLRGETGAVPAGTPGRQSLCVSRMYLPLVSTRAIARLYNNMTPLPEGTVSVGHVAVYRGWVVPPKSGNYRFIGAATDFIIVRLGGKVVLEAGEWLPRLMKKNDPRTASATVGSKHYSSVMKEPKKGPYAGYAYNATFGEIPTWNKRQGGLTLGTPFESAEDKPLEMEVIVASVKEEPSFGYVLYVEDMAAPVKHGKPYSLFCTDKQQISPQEFANGLKMSLPGSDAKNLELPPYDTTVAPWKVTPPPAGK